MYYDNKIILRRVRTFETTVSVGFSLNGKNRRRPSVERPTLVHRVSITVVVVTSHKTRARGGGCFFSRASDVRLVRRGTGHSRDAAIVRDGVPYV